MNRFETTRDDDRHLTEAAMWRVRLTETGATPEFEAWLRDPENQAAWDMLSRPWSFFDEIADAPEMAAAREAAFADAKRAGNPFSLPNLLRPAAALIAATLIIGVVGIGAYWWMNRPTDYQTIAGERRVITLADGSKLSLDANSEVTVRYGKHDRSLHLLKGQARFDVAHDRKRPFSVVAGNQRVIATGTAFNIDMAGPKVLVTLIEGHVVVLEEASGIVSPQVAPRTISLQAGQQLTAAPRLPPEIAQANIRRVTAWTMGQLIFDDEPLSSVVERVNRYGGTQIVITDPQVGAMKISGVFNAGDVLGFVEIVTHYLPVKAISERSSTIALQSQPKKDGAL
jgi:transmembrane sensor